MDLLVFEKFAVISINVLGMFLGVSVYLSNKKSREHLLFLISSIIMLIWIDSSFLLNYSSENQLVLFSGKINLATFSLFCASIYLFIKNFPHDSIRFSEDVQDVSQVLSQNRPSLPCPYENLLRVCRYLSLFRL